MISVLNNRNDFLFFADEIADIDFYFYTENTDTSVKSKNIFNIQGSSKTDMWDKLTLAYNGRFDFNLPIGMEHHRDIEIQRIQPLIEDFETKLKNSGSIFDVGTFTGNIAIGTILEAYYNAFNTYGEGGGN